MAAPSDGVPVAAVEWALGQIGRQVDTMWIQAFAAEALVCALGAANKARATPAQLQALRLTGASADATPLEREYAAL